MNGKCLDHLLSEEERKHFKEQGYLYVPNALSLDMIEHLTNAVDTLYDNALSTGRAKPNNHWGFSNFLGEDDAFLDLVDLPTTLPKVWGILGWNIYLYHAHMHVKPPALPDAQDGDGWLEWHQDSGRVNIEMETHPRPRLSLKVAFFLTDVSEPGRGNFYIRPGSHFSDVPLLESEISRDPREKTASGIPDDAIPVCVEPGTAVLFDRRLWHSRSPNTSQMTRKALFYGYGYRWIRQKDDMTVEHLYERCDPIRRQLLGAAVRNNGRYVPSDEDVPLRGWLIEQFGKESVYSQAPVGA
ncbi:MAG: phytanoyl-CoA dioxygenase family protein [Candidatus Poribacteria bacterium]|nr:phytanoyl-CoA dioxygenase family protein [Candidatus Poribacteria bacterium]